MKTKNRIFGIFFPIFILLLSIAVTLKTVATVGEGYFDYDYKYFRINSLPLIANIIIVSTIVFFIIYILAGVRALKLIPNFESAANYVPSAVVSTALLFMAIHLTKSIKKSDQISFGLLLSFLMVVFAILSIAYLAYNTFFIRTVSARRAGFGLCIVVFLALYLTSLYLDNTTPINSPIKTVDQLTYAFFAVFFLYEVRLSMGREKWKTYIIFGFISAALAAYSSIPALITFFVRKEVISNSIYESVLTFSILIFIICKILLTDKLIEKKESAFIKKLKEASKHREEELYPKTTPEELPDMENEIEEMPDENQISILDIAADEEENDISEEAENTEEAETEEDPTNISTEEDQQ